MKSHYVPQVYLRRWLDVPHKYLYRLQVKPFRPTNTIKGVAPSAVCYTKDFYKIPQYDQAELGIEDSQAIEKHGFKYENILNSLFDELQTKNHLTNSSLINLYGILLSLKRRNPSVKRRLEDPEVIEKAQKAGLDHVRQLLADNITQVWENGFTFESMMKLLEDRIRDARHRPEFNQEQFLSAYLRPESSNKLPAGISHELIRSKFTLFQTTADFPFITNDNPRLTVSINEVIQNPGFDIWSIYQFPISPTHMILLRKDDIEDILPFRLIYKYAASPDLVDIINTTTMKNANKDIYSNSRATLENIKRSLTLKG